MTRSALFENIAETDYLNFFQQGATNYKAIADSLEFDRQEIAKATKTKLSNVRFDGRMPRELQQRIREWGDLLNLVAGYFKGDSGKTKRWFATPNPMLGNITPREMLHFGRYKKLLDFVMEALNPDSSAP